MEPFRDAEAGKLSIITKHGRPAILAIPFGGRLLAHGVHRAMALDVYEAGQATLAQAAKLPRIRRLGIYSRSTSRTGRLPKSAAGCPRQSLREKREAWGVGW